VDIPTRQLSAINRHNQQLFDEFVGAGVDGCRDVEAERLGRLKIDDHPVFCRRLHRQVGRLFALKDAIDVLGGAAVIVGHIAFSFDDLVSAAT
jgi:hypothetical protein